MKIKEFFKENGEVIAMSLLGIGLTVFSAMFGGPRTGHTYDIHEDVSGFFPRNAEEAKILSLYETAKDATWDNTKISIARDISYIAEGSIDDSTKILAINVLNEIIKTCTWDSTKRSINNLIKEV